MRTVILGFGFAEEASVSKVIMSTYHLGGGQDFSPKEGMLKLAEDFYNWHLNLYEDPKECNIDDFLTLLKRFPSLSTDSACWEEWYESYQPIWSPYWTEYSIDDLKTGNFIWVENSAEDLLASLVLEIFPNAFKNADYLKKKVEISQKDLGNILR